MDLIIIIISKEKKAGLKIIIQNLNIKDRKEHQIVKLIIIK